MKKCLYSFICVLITAFSVYSQQNTIEINSSNISKSKSQRTNAPTIIKIKKSTLDTAKKIQSLITAIPYNCNISTCEITYKKNGATSTLLNTGNELHPGVYKSNWIVIENIIFRLPQKTFCQL